MYQNIFVERGEQWGQDVVHLWDDTLGYRQLPHSDFRYAYRPDKNGKYISMTGVRLSKVKRYKKDDLSLFESDVSQETRILTDMYLHEDMPSEGHTVMFFDIEVSMSPRLPRVETAENTITSIAYYDSTTKEYNVLVLDPSGTYQDRTGDGVSVFFYDTELGLLNGFLDQYESVSPTIITGWNSDGFDVPYLYRRLALLMGENTANRLSPIGKVRYSEFRQRYQIAGVSSLDYLALYKKFTYTQLPNYRLDTVGKAVLGVGKVEYDGSLDDLFRTDLDKFIEYNLQDVRLIVEIDRTEKLIELVRGICHVGHVPYEDYSYSSKFLEGTILTLLHRKDIIATNKPVGGKEMLAEKMENDEEGFAGAYVRPPMPGLYEWVYSLDLQSLYPSIIMSLNISPETKVGKITNFDLNRHLSGEMEEYRIQGASDHRSVTLTPAAFRAYAEGEQIIVSANGIIYDGTRRGIIPEILDQWFRQRVEYKRLMEAAAAEGNATLEEFYDRRQHIQKIFLNSLYGVLGLPIFRFFDLDNALAVTASGQEVIKRSARFVSDLYVRKGAPEKTEDYLRRYEKILTSGGKTTADDMAMVLRPDDHCIYIDTDSLYFSAVPLMPPDADPKAYTISIARAVEARLNAYYDELAKRVFMCDSHRLYIKGEVVASKAIWLAKKRYAMSVVYNLEKNKDKDGEPKVKGLDVVRSTFPPAFKRFMEDMLHDIMSTTDKAVIDSKVLAFRSAMTNAEYTEVARNTAAKNISEYDDGSGQLGHFKKSTPAHIKACLNYNRLLDRFGLTDRFEPIVDGMKIQWVYLQPNPLRVDVLAVKGYNDPPQIIQLITDHLDYKALFENELATKLQDFYTALGWGLVPTKVNQNLSEFF